MKTKIEFMCDIIGADLFGQGRWAKFFTSEHWVYDFPTRPPIWCNYDESHFKVGMATPSYSTNIIIDVSFSDPELKPKVRQAIKNLINENSIYHTDASN